MKKTFCHLLLVVVIAGQTLSNSPEAAERELRLLVPGSLKIDTLSVATKPQKGYRTSFSVTECKPISDPELKGSQRNFLELMIICNAVKAADIADTITLASYPNPRRAIAILVEGKADAIGSSLFKTRMADFSDQVNLTRPVISKGDFQVGLFTGPDRSDVLAIRNVKELKKLTGIIVEHWMIDRLTMERLGLKKVITTSKPNGIPKMLNGKRADFTFSYLNRSQTDHLGERMVRIDGFKASLVDDRVLIISKARQDLFDAVQTFIENNSGVENRNIYKAYVHSGFISDQYGDWIDVSKH